jgi:hypothetical protein
MSAILKFPIPVEVEEEPVVFCVCCGYVIDDETQMEETARGPMHEACAWGVYPQG